MAIPAAAVIGGISLLFQAGSSIFGANEEKKAREAQAAWNRWQSNRNAFMSEWMAKESIQQGDEAAQAIQKKGAKVLGAQRVAYAGQGVKVDVGSAADVADETRYAIQKDVLTIKNNAAKQAWGYKVQAENERMAAKYGQIAASNIGNSTLLTGGLKAIGQGAAGFYDLYSGLKSFGGGDDKLDYSGDTTDAYDDMFSDIGGMNA